MRGTSERRDAAVFRGLGLAWVAAWVQFSSFRPYTPGRTTEGTAQLPVCSTFGSPPCLSGLPTKARYEAGLEHRGIPGVLERGAAVTRGRKRCQSPEPRLMGTDTVLVPG